MTSCNVVNGHQSSRGMRCLHLQCIQPFQRRENLKSRNLNYALMDIINIV
jgi:hypothetical protein